MATWCCRPSRSACVTPFPQDAFAARLGGDEFTVIIEAPTASQLLEAGQALALAFQKPHVIEDRELVAGVSVGASIFPDHESEAAALLRAADAALFSAKSAGRSRLAVFEPALLEAASLKFRIEQGLRPRRGAWRVRAALPAGSESWPPGHVPRRGAPAVATPGWAVRFAGRISHRRRRSRG